MNNAAELHVVLGAGQIGSMVVDLLVARGVRVRHVRRGRFASARAGVEQTSGDLSDLAFAEQATRGAHVVYDCTNAAYDQWEALLLPLGRGALHGAAKAGAKLVALDNLYMYGRPDGAMREDSPMRPCSKKGLLRAQLAEERLGAHARGEVRVAIARASDFFGPNITLATALGDRFLRRVLLGKRAECMGDPDQVHSYSYGPDVAEDLVTLGQHDEAMGKVWHLRVNPAESTRAAIARFAQALGAPIGIARVPTWMLRAVGVFSPLMREVAEMAYQWEVPYVLDDSLFRATFGGQPTPIDEAVRATVDWARATFAPRAAA